MRLLMMALCAFFLMSGNADARYKITCAVPTQFAYVFWSDTLNCLDVQYGLMRLMQGYNKVFFPSPTCTPDPVVNGTVFSMAYGDLGAGYTNTITPGYQQFVCTVQSNPLFVADVVSPVVSAATSGSVVWPVTFGAAVSAPVTIAQTVPVTYGASVSVPVTDQDGSKRLMDLWITLWIIGAAICLAIGIRIGMTR